MGKGTGNFGGGMGGNSYANSVMPSRFRTGHGRGRSWSPQAPNMGGMNQGGVTPMVGGQQGVNPALKGQFQESAWTPRSDAQVNPMVGQKFMQNPMGLPGPNRTSASAYGMLPEQIRARNQTHNPYDPTAGLGINLNNGMIW